MDYNNLSDSLRRKISKYNLVTNLYRDVSIAWEVVSYDELSIQGIDSDAVNKLANDLVDNRLILFYRECVYLSDSILKQVNNEFDFTPYAIDTLSNIEKIDRVDALIHNMLHDCWGVRSYGF